MFSLDTFQGLIVGSMILVPIVTGLTSVAKMALNLQSTRFIPLIAVVLGAFLGTVFVQMNILGAMVGIVVGLASTGLWEFGKTTIGASGVSPLNQLQG